MEMTIKNFFFFGRAVIHSDTGMHSKMFPVKLWYILCLSLIYAGHVN